MATQAGKTMMANRAEKKLDDEKLFHETKSNFENVENVKVHDDKLSTSEFN